MGLLDDVGEDIWLSIVGMVPQKKRRRVARAIIDVLEDYDTESLDGTALFEAAFPEDEDEYEDDEDDEDDY